MKRYGEIGRVLSDEGFLYVLRITKFSDHSIRDQLYIPMIVISISRRTGKKNRDKNMDKMDMKFKLVGDVSISTIRQLKRVIARYLKEVEPSYVGYLLYNDRDQEKRDQFYIKSLARMGYSPCDIEKVNGWKYRIFKKDDIT